MTLIAYLHPEPERELPVLSMLMTGASDIKLRAEKFAATVCDANRKIDCRAIATSAAAGGGSLPGESMESFGVVLGVQGMKPAKLAEMLRACRPPVIAIVQNDQLILDFRTISESDEKPLLHAILSIASQ
jgi:L-seryl-tRNA(Ser) seleniumtransferase